MSKELNIVMTIVAFGLSVFCLIKTFGPVDNSLNIQVAKLNVKYEILNREVNILNGEMIVLLKEREDKKNESK
jgi:hypothetical protein